MVNKFRFFSLLGALLFVSFAHAQTATLNWGATYQTMDGFGAQDWASANSLTSAQAAMFFSPSTGIGLAIVRTALQGCPETGSCTVSTANVPDLVTLKEAVANGAQIEINIDPPGNLQYAGDRYNGTPDPSTGNCIDSSNWSAFATFTVDWIEMLNANSAPVSILSVANEPNEDMPYYQLGHCTWTAAGLDSYIGGTLGPAMAAAGLSGVKIMMPEASSWFNYVDLSSTCLNDSTCAQYVSIVAGHGYDDAGAYYANNYCCATVSAYSLGTASGRHLWQSEVNGGFSYNSAAGLWNWDPSMADGLEVARMINDYLTIANVSGWEWWELADCNNVCAGGTGTPLNDGLTEANLTTTSARMYVIGQWSKFVRPGWVRIDATNNPTSGVYVTAFKDPSGTGNFAIIATNQNASNTNMTFNFSGVTVNSATPWVTSASLNLVEQTGVQVTNNTFNIALPAQSVTTFVGTAASNLPPAPTITCISVNSGCPND